MIKRFCDRCGAETFEKNTRIKEKNTDTELWIEKCGRGTIGHTPADLCDNCIKSFRNWWIANERPHVNIDDSPIGGFHDD